VIQGVSSDLAGGKLQLRGSALIVWCICILDFSLRSSDKDSSRHTVSKVSIKDCAVGDSSQETVPSLSALCSSYIPIWTSYELFVSA
jgi:hypothetical protein